ncbi:MAG TPA: MBL fold metallo-hydrolase [bacterium]|nr:MBL fold metallo-hydrolase [bacterium]
MATAKWLGTASLELEHNGQILLIDPHISRPNKWQTFTAPLAPHKEKIDRYLAGLDGEVVGIIVTHAHSDHLSDVPYLAQKLGVPVWGNESVDTTLKAYGLPPCPEVLAHGNRLAIGPFTVEAVKTRHGRVALGKVPFPGTISPEAEAPFRVWQFKHGDPPLLAFITAGGQTILHMGTANMIDNLLPHRRVSSAWLCASGYQYTPEFAKRIMHKIKPKTVLPFHFEDFSLPLSETTRLIPGADPHTFGSKILAAAPGVEIRIPKPYEKIPF